MDYAELPPFLTVAEATTAVERAPDGSLVRPLARLAGLGSVATFELPAGAVSAAVQHATVAEIWYVLSGTGELWRRQPGREEITPLHPGVCVTLPPGTAFQFRAHPAPLERSPVAVEPSRADLERSPVAVEPSRADLERSPAGPEPPPTAPGPPPASASPERSSLGPGGMAISGPTTSEVAMSDVATSDLTTASSAQPLHILGVTMPPWPGSNEAQPTTGPWPPSIP